MKKITGILLMVLCCSLLLSACSGKKGEQSEEKTVNIQPLSGIVVMPVIVTKEAVASMGKGEMTPASIAGFVDELIVTELGKNDNVHIVQEKQLDALLTDAAGGRLAQMKVLGAKMASDAVLEITVTRYRQREGSEMSVNAPASAAFDMVLTNVETGRVLWAASFDETQEALSSNLLSIGKVKNRGLKWITVENLVRQGVKERLADCPYLQK